MSTFIPLCYLMLSCHLFYWHSMLLLPSRYLYCATLNTCRSAILFIRSLPFLCPQWLMFPVLSVSYMTCLPSIIFASIHIINNFRLILRNIFMCYLKRFFGVWWFKPYICHVSHYWLDCSCVFMWLFCHIGFIKQYLKK